MEKMLELIRNGINANSFLDFIINKYVVHFWTIYPIT